MHLINYLNYEVKPSEEAFLVKPIRELYERDNSKLKGKFMSELAIIYFMVDPRSDYMYIIDEGERLNAILKQEGITDFKMDKKLKEAMDIYHKLVETTYTQTLEDTRICIDKIRTFLRNVDLTLMDKNGKPIYTAKDVAATIDKLPSLLKNLKEIEKIVVNEVEDAGTARGGNDRNSMFEDADW